MKRTIFAAALSALTARTTSWHGPTTVVNAQGQTVCALHHTPLRARTAYGFDGCFREVEDYARIRAHYPNPWPTGYHLTCSKDFPNRTTIAYCDQCNRNAGLNPVQ